jgi:hypothetical protein
MSSIIAPSVVMAILLNAVAMFRASQPGVPSEGLP